MIDLIVVLDPTYGDRLEVAAQTAPAWAVATLANKTACQRAWTIHRAKNQRDRGALTCFDVTDAEDRLGNLLGVLPTLEEHHGEIRDDHFSFPNGFVLGVIGLPLADEATAVLAKFGFSSFVKTADGFNAYKQ